MNIAENILKHSLRNVYFLVGTACGGKTTAARALCEKYGFLHFNDNWHEESFRVYRSICSEKYQRHSAAKRETTDWEAFFSRSAGEFLADSGGRGEYDEYLEYAIIELIKLSQARTVVADVCAPIPLLTEISEYNRIACLLAPPELVTCAYYGSRADHKDFLDCILSLKEPEKKIAVQDELFRIGVEKVFAQVREHNLFSIVRGGESTAEGTLKLLEEHFNL